MLCSVCEYTFQGQFPGLNQQGQRPYEGRWRPHHLSRDEVLNAADQGCFLCNRLRCNRTLHVWKSSRGGDQDDLLRYAIVGRNANGTIVLLFVRGVARFKAFVGIRQGMIMLFHLRPAGDVSELVHFEIPFGNTTDSPYAQATVQSWINTCDKKHDVCKSSNRGWIPTRLLQVFHSGACQLVRLVLRAQMQIVPYAALSHCWGKGVSIRLTAKRYREFEKGLPVASLPKTFRDAVAVSLRLGLRYIWIASCCIIQDSTDDWQKEAMNMHKVYANAEITIAATAAQNGDEGLFFDRRPEFVQPCVVNTNWDGLAPQAYVLSDGFMGEQDLDNAPLNRRAWVVQERCLSRKVIHFGAEQLYWECRTAFACEAYPRGAPTMGGEALPYEKPLKVQVRLSVPPPSFVSNAVEDWSKIVKSFTGSRLTFASDKLIAIGGVAKAIHTQTKDQYLAGMWRRDLVFQLDWYVERSSQPTLSQCVTSYIAPSWSWASVTGQVVISGLLASKDEDWTKGMRELARVVDISLQTTSGDPFGQMRSGKLCVEAVTTPLQILQIDEYNRNDSFNYVEVGGKRVNSVSLTTDIKGLKLPAVVTFLSLYQLPTLEAESANQREHGIILVDTDGMSTRYARIGTMHFLDQDSLAAARKTLREPLHLHRRRLTMI